MKLVNKILGYAIAAIMVIMVLGCCWQVITRFILNNPSKYTEELLRYLLIWMTMLGAPYAYGKEKHLSINIITKTFQPKNMLYTRVFIELIILVISIFVLIMGGLMVTSNAAGQISPALQMPMQLYYGCLPLSGVLMALYCIERLIRFSREIQETRRIS